MGIVPLSAIIKLFVHTYFSSELTIREYTFTLSPQDNSATVFIDEESI